MREEYLQVCERFEAFLASIPLEAYRNELMPIKTVEQDLPPSLNPLPDLYAKYWLPNERIAFFPSYEEFFAEWWETHLKPIDDFISRYFWGCSYEFVKKGFKARLYRTAISVWTQFDFGYKYLSYGQFHLEASATLDMKGIDFLLTLPNGSKIALQIKKETYRAEAKERGRLAKREIHSEIEIPCTLSSPDDLKEKLVRPGKKRQSSGTSISST